MSRFLFLCLITFQISFCSNDSKKWFKNPFKTHSWVDEYQPDVEKILTYITKGKGAGKGFEWLANITDTFGNRFVGSDRLDKAIDYVVEREKERGFDNVHAEPVPDLPKWIRGEETVMLLKPRLHKLSVVAVGLSEGGTVNASAVVVRSFAELDKLGKQGKIKGKIVVYNEPWLESYGITVAYRSGANQAAKYGALAALIRSVTPFSIYSPHTGMMTYANDVKHIPAGCITVEDAQMLWRMQQRGQKLQIYVKFGAHFEGTVTSHNTILELKGSEKPDEIVLISGHFDSWDVGQGAMDDGGGCATMWTAINTLKDLGFRPKRTIRVVFWTAEEIGMRGAQHYYTTHKQFNNETFVFVSESDLGAFKPSKNAHFEFSGPKSSKEKLQDIVKMINKNGIELSIVDTNPADQGDVAFWASEGVPAVEYINQDKYDYYFYFHHTNGDTMTVLKPEDLDYLGGVYAVLVHVLANMEEKL